MSQGGQNGRAAGPAPGTVTSINGDIGTAVGPAINLLTNVATDQNGSTTLFTASASTVAFSTADARFNMMFGKSSGNLAGIPGHDNVGLGCSVLTAISTGIGNCGVGNAALLSTSTASESTAVGSFAGMTVNAQGNTIVGWHAGDQLTTGKFNVLLGRTAGTNLTGSESSNVIIQNVGTIGDNHTVRIGEQGTGDTQQNLCFIAGITGATVVGSAVLCDASGQLGTVVSSQRYKEDIKDLTEEESIMNLRPVSFQYKFNGQHSVGLIAEEVDETYPALCIYNAEGKPESVKYHEMPALLLKEIQRLNARIEALEKKV